MEFSLIRGYIIRLRYVDYQSGLLGCSKLTLGVHIPFQAY